MGRYQRRAFASTPSVRIAAPSERKLAARKEEWKAVEIEMERAGDSSGCSRALRLIAMKNIPPAARSYRYASRRACIEDRLGASTGELREITSASVPRSAINSRGKTEESLAAARDAPFQLDFHDRHTLLIHVCNARETSVVFFHIKRDATITRHYLHGLLALLLFEAEPCRAPLRTL